MMSGPNTEPKFNFKKRNGKLYAKFDAPALFCATDGFIADVVVNQSIVCTRNGLRGSLAIGWEDSCTAKPR
jgi:hypothetical protein